MYSIALAILAIIKLRTDGRVDGRTDGRVDGRTDGRVDGRTDGWTDGWTDGRTEGRKDRKTDGRTDRRSLQIDMLGSSRYKPRPKHAWSLTIGQQDELSTSEKG